jgi:hypothetical protein
MNIMEDAVAAVMLYLDECKASDLWRPLVGSRSNIAITGVPPISSWGIQTPWKFHRFLSKHSTIAEG